MIDAGLVLHGRFQVIRHLGAGGMGEVYLGLDRERGENVAIKRMLIEQDHMDKDLFDRRFKEEISILRRLHSTGIPAFVDAFSEDGHSFLVMEFIQGYSLDKLLRVSSLEKVGLSAEQVATVALHVSIVLEYLHSQTPPLVHRDIKPSNLIIRESDQRIFLVDFGLAREIHSKSSAKTQVGTWSYAPIEQIRGWVEPRSDFYSLGVTMLELLTGVVPAALRIPPARKLLPELSEEFAAVIDRCTRAEVTQRYPEACLLRQDLEAVLKNLTTPTESQPSPVSREDTISELVQRWGQGRAMLPREKAPEAFVPGASPEVQKAVDRARRRLVYDSPALRRLRIVGLVVLLFFGVSLGWSAYQERKQRTLAVDSLAGGGPGPGWKCREAKGLSGSNGLGLGFSKEAGVLFERLENLPVRELSFEFRAVRGKPDLLIFSGPFGVHLVPTGSRFQAEVVAISSLRGVAMPVYRPLGLKVGASSAFGLTLTSKKNTLILSRDGREVGRQLLSPTLEWRSTVCGVLATTVDNGDVYSLVSSLVVR